MSKSHLIHLVGCFDDNCQIPELFSIFRRKQFQHDTTLRRIISARFGSTYTKIGTIQRRLAWPLRKDDTQIREAFHIF